MNAKVLIEGIIFLGLSSLSVVEGLRMIYQQDSLKVLEMFGPDTYILSLGIILFVLGLIHMAVHYREAGPAKVLKTDIETRRKAVRLIATVLVYVGLIHAIGYALATPIFFSAAFWIVGVKSWPLNLILSLILSAAFYIIFVVYCNMIFPRGIFF
jgi:Tripartite tricarboxylate transporter TctB family